MTRRYSPYLRAVHRTGDMLLLNLCFFLCYKIILGNFWISDSEQFFRDLKILILMNFIWVSLTYVLRSYHLYRVTWLGTILTNLTGLFILLIALNEAFISLTHHVVDRKFILIYYASSYFSIIGWRVFMLKFIKWFRRRGHNFRKVIIAGVDDASLELFDFFNKHPEHGYRFKGFFDDKNEPGHKISDIENFVIKNKIDEIYCSLMILSDEQLENLVDFADNNLIRINFLPKFKIFNYKKLKIDFYDDIPVLLFRKIPLDDFLNKIIKRIFDILFSLFVIVFCLSWLIPLLAILIKIDSPGPIFFRQKRSGINGKAFTCFKLRTMNVNNNNQFKQAEKNDPRVTRIGRFLRKSSLDEIPQFFNAFLGQMSIVGPRPHPTELDKIYYNNIDKYMVRHFIKPGITGLSQTRGFRGETGEPSLMKNRIRVDIFYIENWSFVLDLRIIYETVFSVFRKNGNNY